MNYQEAKRQLQRINRLFDNLDQEGAQASSLEIDLLKDYVRRFYEGLSTTEDTAKPSGTYERPDRSIFSSNKRKTTPLNKEPHRQTESFVGNRSTSALGEREHVRFEFSDPKPYATLQKEAALIDPQQEQPKPEPKKPAPVQPKPDPVVEKPRLIQIPEEVEREVRSIEETQPVQVEEEYESKPDLMLERETSPFADEPEELPAELQELFAIKSGTDLSDRLSGTRIADLNRAMGLNEVLQTRRELFGNNKAEFDTALRHLNTLDTYEEAVSYLGSGAAKKYDWTAGERAGTARTFIKLVRRRYA